MKKKFSDRNLYYVAAAMQLVPVVIWLNVPNSSSKIIIVPLFLFASFCFLVAARRTK